MKIFLVADSSKIGNCSFASLGPISLVHTLITDNHIDEEAIKNRKATGKSPLLIKSFTIYKKEMKKIVHLPFVLYEEYYSVAEGETTRSKYFHNASSGTGAVTSMGSFDTGWINEMLRA